MIPKVIHYVWVGDKDKPVSVKKCIESWKKYCPDYEIKEWGNKELSKIDNLYVAQAKEYKKWAFVSDYLRLYALCLYGGFYFDTDLELTQPIDIFLNHKFLTGYEKTEKGICYPMTAFLGAEKNSPLIHNLLRLYDNLSFVKNGELDLTTNVVRIFRYLHEKFGISKFVSGEESLEFVKGCVIYPSFYFCVPEHERENYAIHHFEGSWLDAYSRRFLFSFADYKVIVFKKRKCAKEDILPLYREEKKILSINISRRKKICLIKQRR